MPQRPGPMLRLAFRIPIVVFRLGLGWVFGERILMVVHIGRRSGLLRETCLEVIGRSAGEYFVISAFGPTADWLLNIGASRPIEVRVGTARFAATHRILDAGEGGRVLAAYEAKHPRLFGTFARWFGWQHDGTKAAFEAIAADHPVVAFASR